jgi:predicted O-methyltransferase YrrM
MTTSAPAKTWKDVPGWFDFQDIYDEAVARAPAAGAHFVELGVLFGRSSIYMATQILSSGKSITFDAVDNWPSPFHLGPKEWMPEAYNQPRRLMQSLVDSHGGVRQAFRWFAEQCNVNGSIHVVDSDLRVAAQLHRYQPASLDFVFLDADHSEEGTRAAINAWLPKVKPGGVFAGHDFVEAWPGVVAAVKALLPGAVARGKSFFYRVPV